jgi:hypothetical protein
MDSVLLHVSGSDPLAMRFLAVKGTPALGKAFPFAGRRRNAGLGRIREDGGSLQPTVRRVDDGKGVLGWSYEEGNLHLRRPEASGGGR